MSQTICRMYASPGQAHQAAEDLRNSRFDRFDHVHVIGRDAGQTHDAVTAAIMKAYVLRDHARIYAQGVLQGGTLVVVHASFGTAVAAMQILDEHEPVDSGVAEAEDRPLEWDEATPVSNVLHMPVLLDDSATFARFWNVPPLSKNPTTTSSALGIPELSARSDVFNGTFGMALLSDKPTILSSMLGLPVLKKTRTA